MVWAPRLLWAAMGSGADLGQPPLPEPPGLSCRTRGRTRCHLRELLVQLPDRWVPLVWGLKVLPSEQPLLSIPASLSLKNIRWSKARGWRTGKSSLSTGRNQGCGFRGSSFIEKDFSEACDCNEKQPVYFGVGGTWPWKQENSHLGSFGTSVGICRVQ